MNKFENEKRCQTYEVTDFQHNFEIDRPVTVAQQWGLHIHSTHYEVIVFIRGNVDFWIEGRRKKLEYGDIVIVNPREIHRTFLQDDSEYPFINEAANASKVLFCRFFFLYPCWFSHVAIAEIPILV